MKKDSFKKLIAVSLCYSLLTSYNVLPMNNAWAMAQDGSVTLLTARALYYFNQDKLDQSLQIWYKVLEQNPKHKLANEYIEKISSHKDRDLVISEENIDAIEERPVIFYTSGEMLETDSIESIILKNEIRAYEAYSDEKYSISIKLYNQILSYQEDNIRIRMLLATVLMKAEHFDEAIKEWEKILDLDKNNPQAKAYIKILSESTYQDLNKIPKSVSIPKPKVSRYKDPIFTFEGVETSVLFSGYFTDRTLLDEHTLHLGTSSTFKSRLYDNPLHLVVAGDAWRTHGDFMSGVGTWENGDYELNHRFRQATLKFYGKELQILAGDISTHYLFSKNPSHFFLYIQVLIIVV